MCVPSMISAITGISTDEAAAEIAAIRGTPNATIKACYPSEALKVLDKLGYSTHYVRPLGSLYMTCTYLSTLPNAAYYIGVPHHAVCIEVVDGKVFFLDSRTKQPMSAGQSARLMQRVTHVWKITKKDSRSDSSSKS